MLKNILTFLLGPFHTAQGVYWPLLALFIAINGIVLFNSLAHDPKVGYDSRDYIAYIDVLSEGRLPEREETKQFFSPPLPFVASAALQAFWQENLPRAWRTPPGDAWAPNFLFYNFTYTIGQFPLGVAAKLTQLLNGAYSLILTFYLLKLVDLIKPENNHLKLASLGFLGILPVYYKTFAYVRAEPLLGALAVLAAYLCIKIFILKERQWHNVILLGVMMGIAILTRQWAFLLFPGIGMFALLLTAKRHINWRFLFTSLGAMTIIAFLVGGWYYLQLIDRFGTALAFNRDPAEELAIDNQSLEFYFGLGLDEIFTDPIRRSFSGQIIPVIYSEVWGDYWAYFTVFGRETDSLLFVDGPWINDLPQDPANYDPADYTWRTNRYDIAAYLGRVNLLALLPTGFFLAGVAISLKSIWAVWRQDQPNTTSQAYALFAFIILCTAGGFLWFLVRYTHQTPSTIKASYMLQMLPVMAILAGEALMRFKARWPKAFPVTLILLALVILHNLPTLFTRYNTW
ncbi:MAG: hypothetical protein HND51_18830 [Chloroflexi bacterium]|nr:hypothetical protein [Chloroflexota bacterium]